MSTRKSFLSAAASVAAIVAARANAAAAPSPSPAPTPSAPKPPSEAARAIALRMRRFDAKLSDAEIDTIARGIDDNWSGAAPLNPKGKALRNSDEPDTSFSVRA